MYPLRLVDLTSLEEDLAANDKAVEERSSDVRLRGHDDDTSRADEPNLRPTETRAKRAKPVDLDDPSERATTPPPRTTLQPPQSRAGLDTLDEVLFRFSCGDFDGALAAAEALMTRVPVVIMPRSELRAEPLGYWHLLLLARIDHEATLADLLADVPAGEAVRVVCELVERRIIALR